MITQVSIGNGRWLDAPAAASLARVNQRLGRQLDINDAGRTHAEQWSLWNRYQNGDRSFGRPAYPGTSKHETGLAIDTDDRISWIGQHGWVADVAGEPWHFEYRANLDQHRGTAPVFPLAAGSYFGPKSGPAKSVSGYFSHRADLTRWQQRMRDRGWQITADGLYGPQTKAITRAFQTEKGLLVDGLIGPATWRAAWESPIT